MPAHAPIAVTGGTGHLGGRVAGRLAAAGVPMRLLARDPARLPHVPNASSATASYADRAGCERALTGIDTVLMVSATESTDRLDQHRTFVDAAFAAGVRHVVYTSFFNAAPDATFTHARDHWHTEQHIRASGLDFTFLRDNIYLDFLPAMAGDDGVIRGPAGSGRAAAVAQDDIAEVAALVLQAPGDHAGASYDLTGPDALTLGEAAEIISAVTGRRISYAAETQDEAFASRARYGAPDWLVEAWVSTYTAIAAGELDGVSTAVSDLTGHPATGLEQLLRRAA